MMNNLYGKTFLTVLAVLIILVSPALSENSPWDCPECGMTDNTGNYCENCGQSAPWLSGETQTTLPDTSSVLFGLNIPIEEFDRQARSIFGQAKTWTEDSAPQTLDSFPLMPESVFQLYNDIAAAPIQLEKKGEQYYLTTCIDDLVSGWSPDSRSVQFQYEGDTEYHYVDLLKVDDHTYVFSLPDGISIDDVGLAWDYSWYDIGSTDWTEILQIRYGIQDGKVNDELFVGIIMSGDSYSLSWYPGFSVFDRYNPDIISIDVYSFIPNQRIWELDYNTRTGELVRIYQ